VGANVAVGDVDRDGYADLITGATAGNVDVRVYSGLAIANHTFDNTNVVASQTDQFFAYALRYDVGATLGAADFEGTGKAAILRGASQGPPAWRVVRGDAVGVQPRAVFEGLASDFQGGITVAA